MKSAWLFLVLLACLNVHGQQLPAGVKMDTVPCSYATGQSCHYFYKNNEMIGVVQPASCHYSETQGGRAEPYVFAEFYMDAKKDTFPAKQEAIAWMIAAMGEFYKPVVVTKWQKLRVQPPKVSLKYPWDWSYRLDRYDGIFKSRSLSENKVTLMLKDQRGQSEVVLIIRTPNTARLTTAQVMEMASAMNRAINVSGNRAAGMIIGGRNFKTTENEFMLQMHQRHFWYADEQEIIYISCNLLKDERTRYPEVIRQILESIRWD